MKKINSKYNRFTAIFLIMVFILSLIGIRLVYLQLIKGEYYLELANRSSIREINETAPRGNITDSNGIVLATSKESYTLVFNQTSESDSYFYDTMEKVFKILDENDEVQQDEFELKINPYRFEFRASDAEGKRYQELMFKKNRGFDAPIKQKLYKNKTNLTKEEQNKVDEELLKITAEETFKTLVEKKYKIDKKTNSIDEQRRYMIVKDTEIMQSYSGYKSVVVASNIKKETALIFLQKLNDLPGIDVSTEPIRKYPFGELGSAVLGYISKISSDQSKYQEKGYDTNSDYIGVAGIEGAFEDRLKGSKGVNIVKLNKQGRIIEELGRREAYPGQNIQLTIDKNVQLAAETSLDNVMKNLQANPNGGDVNTANATRGAAVAVNIKNGSIVALASRPGYDPNVFSVPGLLTTEMYQKYFNPDLEAFGKDYISKRGLMNYYQGKDINDVLNKLFPVDTSISNNTTIRQDTYDIYAKPFFNYATQSVIPPGSTFKPMTAIAGLESGVITPSFSLFDKGTFDMGGGHITNFAVGGYGNVDLARALEVSSNPYFMTVGKMMRDAYDDDILAKYSVKFGLGVPQSSNAKMSTGIEIPEKYGQVFNSTTLKNIYATQYWWQTMATLKSGNDSRGNKFTSINLYENTADSAEIKAIKEKIKTASQECIRNGSSSFNKTEFQNMIKSLVAADPAYNGIALETKDLNNIINAIYYVTISDANSQIRVGANMYNAAIGQGISNFTPLQLVNYMATIANGGTRYQLHLVDKITDADGNLIEEVKPVVLEETGVSKGTLDAVKYGLSLVTGGEDGTAAAAFSGFPIKTAGKTGSATFSNQQEAYGRTSYAVYVGYAPYDNPEIAVCVVVFDGGHGGLIAPVARAMYDAYFKIGAQN